MQLTDDAIVLSTSKYGENSGIVCVLTESHGVYKGLVRGITSAKQRGLYQSGNIVEITWRARLAEQLGNITGGLIRTGAVNIMQDHLRLSALSSLCALLEATLQERDPAPKIYTDFKAFIMQLSAIGNAWQRAYVLLELDLLAQLGFGLDLSTCAATGVVEELVYVSPKSGRAVSRDAGKPYCDKLLRLPGFLLDSENAQDVNASQINDGLKLCSYFLDKYYFTPHNINQPQARARFVGLVIKTLS